MSTTQQVPTITWNQITDGDNGSYNTTPLTDNNTISYGAVQAGEYSKVICVRPSFNADGYIGKVKFWLQNYQAKNDQQANTSIDITDNTTGEGWLMKYYVSSTFIPLSVMNGYSQIRTATGQISTTITGYHPSVWQQYESSSSSNVQIPMQPIPIAKNATNTAYPSSFSEMKNFYSEKGWQDLFSNTQFSYAYGGRMGDERNCNITLQTDGDSFPFVYLSIKPPTSASAGNWNNFACRLSFLWPWDTTIQE